MTEKKNDNKQAAIRRITYLIIASVIVVIFVFAGITKFTTNEQIVNNFSKWNLLKWKEVIGAIELLTVILYLIPKTNTLGAVALTFTMLGAVYIHFSYGEPYFFELAIILVIWINFLLIKPKKTLH